MNKRHQKAANCILIAQKMFPRGTEEFIIESQAADFMDLSEKEIEVTFLRQHKFNINPLFNPYKRATKQSLTGKIYDCYYIAERMFLKGSEEILWDQVRIFMRLSKSAIKSTIRRFVPLEKHSIERPLFKKHSDLKLMELSQEKKPNRYSILRKI
jgi:hypothetical protein